MAINRRSFLTAASALAAGHVAGLRPFGMLNALAQPTGDYRALVCVFLFGGNDGNNMIIPYDSAGYSNYASIRGDLALPQAGLLPLGTNGSFALNSTMPEVQALFNNKNAALVANVGTLLAPTTRAQYLAANTATPVNLFSHPDQQLEWQNQGASAAVHSGWAGRVADMLQTQMNPSATIPMICSIHGDSLFCDGDHSGPFGVAVGGPRAATCSDGPYCSGRSATAQQLAALSSGVTIVQADNSITSDSIRYNSLLSSALSSAAGVKTPFVSGNEFAAQLQTVARLIQVQGALDMQRQIFFVGAGNFDTHFGQVSKQATLLTDLSSALGSFYSALEEIGMASQVTTFTCSDFARTFQPNTLGGSDHAWGSHHIVMGGAVAGGKMYGTYPTLELGGADDSGSNGRWIPTTSASAYAATLAQWYGVPAADMGAVFPYLANFSKTNLGFLG